MAEDLKGSYIFSPYHPGKPRISATGTSRFEVYHLFVLECENDQRQILWSGTKKILYLFCAALNHLIFILFL